MDICGIQRSRAFLQIQKCRLNIRTTKDRGVSHVSTFVGLPHATLGVREFHLQCSSVRLQQADFLDTCVSTLEAMKGVNSPAYVMGTVADLKTPGDSLQYLPNRLYGLPHTRLQVVVILLHSFPTQLPCLHLLLFLARSQYGQKRFAADSMFLAGTDEK